MKTNKEKTAYDIDWIAKGYLMGIVELVLVGTLAIPIIIGSRQTYLTGCETYQGYRRDYDGELYLYFDDKQLNERGLNAPNHTLIGDNELRDQLEMGKSYRLRINEGLGGKRLISASVLPCTNSEQNSQVPGQ